jgi:alkaline phosphatase
MALDETVEFAKAVKAAADLTDEEDTLIVVTADHAHTLSVNGYPVRGNNIFGKQPIAESKTGL